MMGIWQGSMRMRVLFVLVLCLAFVLTGGVLILSEGRLTDTSPSALAAPTLRQASGLRVSRPKAQGTAWGRDTPTAVREEERQIQQHRSPEMVATQRPTPASTRTPVSLYFPLYMQRPTPVRIHFPIIGKAQPTPTPTATSGPTSTPAPTPTPTPPWPEPLEKPGRSKLGLHVEWNNSPDIMEFIRRTKPAVIKAAGDLGFLAEVKEVSPSTVTVARLAQRPQKLEGDPVLAARAFVARNLKEYQLNPAVDYWEGWNEPDVHGRLDWYAAFEAERARLMAEHGFRVAVGGFSAGVPEWEDFAAFLPAIEAAQKYGGIFTLHEYDAPALDRSVGAGLPGRPGHPDRGALALRYRWWYEDFLKPRGLVIALVISEAGIDGGIGNRPGPPGLGWRDFVGYWSTHGLGEDGVQAYIRQLAWYDAELQQDDYVIGFAVFTAGVMTERWKTFDITDILRNLAIYVVGQR